MKEIAFINKHKKRWSEFEKILDNKTRYATPDKLATLFIELTDDLAYSQTFYPKSRTTLYLNDLAVKAYHSIYKNKQERGSRVLNFWKKELPLILYSARKYMYYSAAIFIVAVLIGIFSAASDENFVRTILGDDYVNTTIKNIETGNPMGIYNSSDEFTMFVTIAFNNIRVSFLAFLLGIFFSVGTVYLLISNGIMLGSFQYFFFKYNLLYDSMITIWIHGVLEIFVIIVSGAAGLMLGGSIMFPETYSRIDSLRKKGKDGVKIIVGLVPVFIIAAFFEGYFTRHTEWHDSIQIGIIILSILFIIWYFFLYPKQLYSKSLNKLKA